MRLSKKRKKIFLKVLVILAGIAVIALLYFFFTYSKFYITDIKVNNEKYQDGVSTLITNEFSDRRWYVFPSGHIVFVPRSRIEKHLRLLYPEIKSLSISKKNLHEIDVDLVLRKPIFRLEDGLALDEDGVVYHEPNDISKLPLFTFAGDFPVEDEVHSIDALLEKLSVRLSSIEGVEINSEKDVKYYFDNGHSQYVITSLSSDVNILWSTLLSALDTNPLAGLLQTNLNQLEYIDLRFGNKVFYKFMKGKTAESKGTTTETVLH